MIYYLQVYKVVEGRYVHYDRVFGRTVTERQFPALFHEYLQDGHPMSRVLLSPILLRLRQLHRVLSSQQTFRYYSGSLLIIYDAADLIEVTTNQITENITNTDSSNPDSPDPLDQCYFMAIHCSNLSLSTSQRNWSDFLRLF